uniref:Uncharacterized protein n=1 Tax=uncultured bacterium contig00085 TaxID=1181558 RepID=A0A806JZV9_9BACT|nr:hypothetical protein [uncultured bacterium contig00085]
MAIKTNRRFTSKTQHTAARMYILPSVNLILTVSHNYEIFYITNDEWENSAYCSISRVKTHIGSANYSIHA